MPADFDNGLAQVLAECHSGAAGLDSDGDRLLDSSRPDNHSVHAFNGAAMNNMPCGK
jgi:hypothetical protein